MKNPLFAGAVLLLFLSQSYAQSVDDAAELEQTQEQSQLLPDSAVVAERGGEVLTMGDMRAKLRASMPESKRRGFFSDGARVAPLIDGLLGTQQLAAVARENGLDKDPALRAEVEGYERNLLARRQILQHMSSLEEPDYEILARERYLANKASYVLPETRDVRHILIRTGAVDRSEQQAADIARSAHALLADGGDFDELFEEYAEDGNATLQGWVRGIKNDGSLDPAFAKVAFAMETPGEVSEPVLSSFGYHVIRLEGITPGRDRPYDEVKDQLVDEVRREFRAAARATYVESFTSQPLQLNEETMMQLPTQE